MYLYNIVRPFVLDGDLVRYGNKSDGGYVVNDKYLKLSNTLYTYGVGGEISFEDDLIKNYPEYKIHLYDPTITEFPKINKQTFNHLEGLSYNKSELYNNFLEHVKENNDQDSKILLKIDIEGGELDFFQKVDLVHFSNVVQMIIEFHIDRGNNILDFINCINYINTYFYSIHIHANNHGGLISMDGYQFPVALECSYINKSYVKETPVPSQKTYPLKDLDFPNFSNLRDYTISYS